MSRCIDNNFTNFNLIDPNCIILKGTPWYDSDDERLGIPPFEDIRSYVELKMKPKNPNFIQIEKDKDVLDRKSEFDGTKLGIEMAHKKEKADIQKGQIAAQLIAAEINARGNASKKGKE